MHSTILLKVKMIMDKENKKEFYKDMGARIKARRIEIGLSQDELAAKAGFTSRTSISKIESGANGISQAMVSTVAQILCTTPDYIMGWETEDDFEPDAFNFYKVEKKSIPILGSVACGEPILMAEISYADVADAAVDADFALYAKGDSMTGARIYDGDLVFVKRTQEVRNGEIAVVAIDDEATLKRFYYDAENAVLSLVAENPNYAPMVFTGKQLSRVQVIGKAIMYQSLIR